MSEYEYNRADMEVISMVSDRRNRAGRLPSKTVHYIPEERAGLVLDLDRRIEKIRNALPGIALAATVICALLIGTEI